ncbi:MAG: ferrochelatase [Rhodothermales bacterium]|jgi:ferrochelatase
MTVGVVMLNFGEPETPTREEVVPFLERIFLNNAPLERFPNETARLARCRQLAEDRAPGLIADYERIGGSPLNAQARDEAQALQDELTSRGLQAKTRVGMQFTDPTIREAVEATRADGADVLVALPMYPICGFSTNVAAIKSVRDAVSAIGWDAPVYEVAAWHHDDAYTRYRADNIRSFAHAQGVDLSDDGTLLYFSAHGTPIKYLDLGSRYDGYVEEHCERIAHLLGGVRYTLGYQNHSNRGIAWTKPDNEEHLPTVRAERVVVEPISFIHEQSETLAELDLDFRAKVEALGMAFHRVPTPNDHARLARVLADLIVPALQGVPADAGLHPCRCSPGSLCTNGHRTVDCHFGRRSTATAG